MLIQFRLVWLKPGTSTLKGFKFQAAAELFKEYTDRISKFVSCKSTKQNFKNVKKIQEFTSGCVIARESQFHRSFWLTAFKLFGRCRIVSGIDIQHVIASPEGGEAIYEFEIASSLRSSQ